MRIPLGHDLFSEVDDDCASLAQAKWRAYWNESIGGHYAARRVSVNGRETTEYLHRAVMRLKLGRPLERHEDVDHANHITLDNRGSNLRVCSRSQNNRNNRPQKRSRSGFKGVSFCKQTRRWEARIRIEGRQVFLGRYADPKDAARAYDAAAVRASGDFALTNEKLGVL